MTDRKDREIIEEVRGGKVDAFEELIVRYQSRVFAIVSRHLPPDRAAEAAHDVFCRAYRSLGGYRPEKPFEHWLSKVAVRTCHDYWRRQKRSREIVFSAFNEDGREALDAILAGQANDDYAAGRRRLYARELLDRILARLPADDRMALSLTYLEGHSLREAAELMGWSTARMNPEPPGPAVPEKNIIGDRGRKRRTSMNNQDERKRLFLAALRDAHNHPPVVPPDERWRKGVMAEVRAEAAKPEQAHGPVFVPDAFFRLAPVLTAASVAAFAVVWSTMGGLYNELALLVLTNLPRTAELCFFGL